MVPTRFELGLHPTDSVLIDCESKETHSGSIWTQDVFVTAVIEFTFWVLSDFDQPKIDSGNRTPLLRNWTNERKTKIWLGRPTLNAVMANFVCGANPKSRNSRTCECCEFLWIENEFWHNPAHHPQKLDESAKNKIWFGRPSKLELWSISFAWSSTRRIQSVAVRNPLTDLPKPLMCRTRYTR